MKSTNRLNVDKGYNEDKEGWPN